jgi:hypothetical protein
MCCWITLVSIRIPFQISGKGVLLECGDVLLDHVSISIPFQISGKGVLLEGDDVLLDHVS